MPDSPSAASTPAALDGLSDAELLAQYRGHAPGSEERDAACELLVRRYTPLVRACVRPYRNSPEAGDDLMQVGFVGLIKAIRRFDPTFGNELRAYAAPCISGELKRHFRDKRWQVRVTRPVQELVLEIRGATEDLVNELGRQPEEGEISQRLGVTPEDLQQARQAAQGFTALSLDAPVGEDEDAAGFGDLLGADDAGFAQATNMQAVEQHWAELPRREQQILLMRFYGNHSQQEVADKLGISQMHVSRLQARALAFLRAHIDGPDDASPLGETG